MEGKIPAVIRLITFDGRTYHNVALSPTLINFFYGKSAEEVISFCEDCDISYHIKAKAMTDE